VNPAWSQVNLDMVDLLTTKSINQSKFSILGPFARDLTNVAPDKHFADAATPQW
jgi:hypothetical protein